MSTNRAKEFRSLKFYPEIYAMRARFNWLIKKGKIKRPKFCSQCHQEKSRLDAHHSDYSKPLKVKWLCRSCHFSLHGKLNHKKLLQPLEKMKAGDSFLIPKEINHINVRYSFYQFIHRKNLNWKFAVRKTPKGYRCWRIK